MKIYKGERVVLYEDTPRECEGQEWKAEDGSILGIFTGTVGEWGTSTGIFTGCQSACPFGELGLEKVVII